jgi:hypothetical protein
LGFSPENSHKELKSATVLVDLVTGFSRILAYFNGIWCRFLILSVGAAVANASMLINFCRLVVCRGVSCHLRLLINGIGVGVSQGCFAWILQAHQWVNPAKGDLAGKMPRYRSLC